MWKSLTRFGHPWKKLSRFVGTATASLLRCVPANGCAASPESDLSVASPTELCVRTLDLVTFRRERRAEVRRGRRLRVGRRWRRGARARRWRSRRLRRCAGRGGAGPVALVRDPRGSSRRFPVMRSRPANVGLIHRRCRRPSAAQDREATQHPKPDPLTFCSKSKA